MNDRIRNYILEQLNAIAKRKFPNNVIKQQAYIIGFLTQQLTIAVDKDSHVLDQIRRALDKLKQ